MHHHDYNYCDDDDDDFYFVFGDNFDKENHELLVRINIGRIHNILKAIILNVCVDSARDFCAWHFYPTWFA
jgi:hypothetical protein